MVFGMCKSLLLLAAALWSEAASAAEKFGATRACLIETEFAKDMETNFVQKQLTVSSNLAEEKREREREQAHLPRRIHWVHVAKTGSSFLSTLLQLDDPICKPGSGHLIASSAGLPTVADARTWCPGIMLYNSCSDDQTFDSCCERPIGDLESNAAGLVGFFRKPEVRIMSDFNARCLTRGTRGTCEPERTPEQHGQLVQGCTVKMLTLTQQLAPEVFESIESESTPNHYHCDTGIIEPPTWAQVDRALHRVQHEYVFIGMTDDWDLSICLFNAMFGNACHSSQFASIKFKVKATDPDYDSSDVSPLNGWVDPYDAVLWEAAQRIFQRNLLRFNVSKETCRPC